MNLVANAAKNMIAGGSLSGFFSLPVVTFSDRGELQCRFSYNFRGFSTGGGGQHFVVIPNMGSNGSNFLWIILFV
jgi:hypothetical protein